MAVQKKATKSEKRCGWCNGDAQMDVYHDEEWGVPVYDDRKLFEFLILEGAQAGLSWSTVFNKRKNYEKAFAKFDPVKVARFDKDKVRRLLLDPGLIRNRRKIESAIKNAKAFLLVEKEFGSFADYAWQFVGGKPIQNSFKHIKDVPYRSDLSEAFSKDLKKRGFSFVGPGIMYAYMQAMGMVNDHSASCFRHGEVKKLGKRKLTL